jgi:hypothetical protein
MSEAKTALERRLTELSLIEMEERHVLDDDSCRLG